MKFVLREVIEILLHLGNTENVKLFPKFTNNSYTVF